MLDDSFLLCLEKSSFISQNQVHRHNFTKIDYAKINFVFPVPLLLSTALSVYDVQV